MSQANNAIDCIDDEYIYSLFLSEEDREGLRSSRKFKRTNKLWNKGKFNYIESIGSLSRIISTAHSNWRYEKRGGIMTKRYFVGWYIDSGAKRNKLLNANKKNQYHINTNNGRTMHQLYYIALAFKEYVNNQKEENIKLTIKEAFNYVIIRVFDETYEGFLREENTMKNISNFLNGKYEFIPSDINQDVFYSIDYIGYDKEGEIACALQIKPNKYFYAKDNIAYKQINVKKHKKFYQDFNVEPIIVYSTIKGYILNNKEVLQKLNKK